MSQRHVVICWVFVCSVLMSMPSHAVDDCPPGPAAIDDALAAQGEAFADARGRRDDAAGASAARGIAALGLCSGDPLKAQNWLLVAERLDPEHPELGALQAALDTAREELSAEEIDTGLSQTRGLGVVNNLLGGDVAASNFWDAEDEGAGSEDPAADEDSAAQAINIPIRFASNSTELTGDTARNVRNLASVLADMPASTTFSLTGHADVRGDADYNLRLSLARAEAIRGLLIAQAPSLSGRVTALGAGEARPLDGGDSDRAHANNRRLEVRVIAGTAPTD